MAVVRTLFLILVAVGSGRVLAEEPTPSTTVEGDFSAMIADLKSEDAARRRKAAVTISESPREQQRQALAGLIERIPEEKDPQVRLALMDALTALGPDAADAAPALIEALPKRFGEQSAAEDHVRHRTAWALGAIGAPSVGGLRTLLGHERARIRELAAMALGRVGPPAAESAPDLLKLLTNTEEDARREAIRALGNLGDGARATLVGACRDENPQVRSGAVTALGRLPMTDDSREVILSLTSDSEAGVRAAAVLSLTGQDIADEALRSILANALNDGSADVRTAAINVLADDRELLVSMTPVLRERLVSTDPGVSRHAAHLLGRMGTEAAPALIEALADPNCRVDDVAEGLTGIGRPVVPRLVEQLGSDDARVRSAVTLALGRIRPVAPEAVEQLTQRLTDSSDDVRIAALDSLGQLGRQARSSVPALRERLKDENAATRLRATETLFQVASHDDQLLDDYLLLLEDADPRVQTDALVAIRRLGPLGRRALPQVVPKVGASEPSVRLAAAEMIGSHGRAAKDAVPQLTALLAEPDAALKTIAAETLGKLGEAAQSAGPALVDLLSSSEAGVRAAAITALAGLEMPAREMRPHLNQTLADADASVREAALGGLRRFGRRGVVFVPDLIRQVGGPIDAEKLTGTLRRYRRSGPDPTSIPELIELLGHENPAIRKQAIEFLGLAGKDGEPALARLEELKSGADEETAKLIETARTRIEANERGLKDE